MAAPAAALRLLLRRRAPAAPSLALLQPLFPGPFSTPCSPLLSAAASAALLDVRRAQVVSLALAPYLLRHYSSKPSKGSAPWRPTSRKGSPRKKQVKHCSIVTYLETLVRKMLFLNGLQKDVLKRVEMLNETMDACLKASHLLVDEGWDDRAIAMFENALDNHWKTFAAYEKGVDDFAKAVGSTNGLPAHILEQYQASCKKMKDCKKILRQKLEELSGTFETRKMRKKINKAVGLGICLVLTVVIELAYEYLLEFQSWSRAYLWLIKQSSA
ncbi:uncharacterized protein LOC120699270 isoform X4 [Panicum virgatum]|uniref:uncharacterized protein LOC120699270 isoform X4 n=1 Tax=Panicum virgatum TaxID=38727 RepID=UPI0019D662B6|nr:uncharacterized protein LOC120699270 isoform X4 [Panicum virgatum]